MKEGLEYLTASDSITLKQAMELIDKNGECVLMIVEDKKLVGILTDGDIRRALLSGSLINDKIRPIINRKFKYCTADKKQSARLIMNNQKLRFLPIVDENKNLTDVIFWDRCVEIKNKINIPVVIQAGGKGTRLYPYTKVLPKPLIPVGETPIIELIMDNFHDYGCNEFYIIVNYKKNMIKSYFDELNKEYKINYIDEPVPLGTGGGLTLLKDYLNGDFIFANCDTIINEDYSKILAYHKNANNLITMVCADRKIKLAYGVIKLDENNEYEKILEKPEYSFLINAGMYIVSSRVIKEKMVENQSIGFPTVFEKLKQEREKVGIYTIESEQWMDMGEPAELEAMRQKLETVLN